MMVALLAFAMTEILVVLLAFLKVDLMVAN
jgi:hypothetical protein